MKKWYFSDNGKVTGPYTINDAHSLLSKNSDLYAWNPSFSQWLPVTQITELSELIPESKPAAQIPKELIDKFVTKKRDLNKKVTLIDEAIKKTQEHMKSFEKEIDSYKTLTESLSSDVKDNILPIEKKYQLVSKQLKELAKAGEIAKQEIIDVVQEFGDLVLSKSNENSDDLLELTDLPELKKTKEVVQIKETPNKASAQPANKEPVKSEVKKVVNKPVVVEKSTQENVVTLKENKAVQINDKEERPSIIRDQPKEDLANTDKKSFSDVKNKLKSVFKTKPEEPPIKLSDQLKQLEEDTKEELIYIDSDLDDNTLEDDDEQKKKRRRRRRF